MVLKRPSRVYFLTMVLVPRLLVVLSLVLPGFAASTPQQFDQIAHDATRALVEERTNDAIRLYQAGVKLRPDWTEGWWSLGSLLYDQDRFSEAAPAFRRFVRLTPKPAPAYAFLGLCEYETREYDHALQHFRAWGNAGWPGTRELVDVGVYHFVLLLTRQGEFLEALYLLTPEVVRLGNTPAITEAMGLASLRMRNLPEDYPADRREMVWLAGEAAAYAEHFPPDYSRADEFADRLVTRYPNQPEVHYFRGTLFNFERKNSSEAEREFREELRLSPNHVSAMLELANIDISSNQVDEASSLAKRALELEPRNAEAHHAMGRALLAADQIAEGARELEIAKQLAPASSSIRSHLAIAYGKLGRSKEARAEAALSLSLKKKEDILTSPEDKLKAPEPEEKP